MDRGTRGVEYVIEESTTVSHLSGWIERDTGVRVGSQLVLLAPTGKELQKSDPLFHLVQQLREEDRLVVVFDVDPPSGSVKEQIRSLPIVIPASIQPFLQNPRQEVTWPHKKLVYSHGFHFAASEQAACRQFSQGIRVFILYLLNKIKDLNSASQAIAKSYEKASAKFDFFRESLKHDVEKYTEQAQKKDRITSNQIFESWKRSETDIERQSLNVRDELARAEAAMKRVNGDALEIQKLPKQAKADDLHNYVEKSVRLIESLRTIPVEGRREKENVMEIAQLVVRCLKQRDAFLQEHFAQRARLREVHSEVLSLAPLQGMLRHNLDAFSATVSKQQRRRQSDIWKLLSAAVHHKSGGGSSPSVRRSPSTPNASPMPSPMVGAQESALLFDSTSLATRKAVEENQVARSHLQEFVHKNKLDDYD